MKTRRPRDRLALPVTGDASLEIKKKRLPNRKDLRWGGVEKSALLRVPWEPPWRAQPGRALASDR